VHVQYVKKHYARLSNADFEDSSRVVKLSLRNGDLVGYYYKEAFVRQQTSRGLRCDLHESYSCEHVQYIQGIHQEDMVQNAADEDESDGGDIQMFKPVDEAMSVVERYIHDHPEAISVPFPYSKKLRDQARRIDMVGLDSWVCPAGQQYDPIDRLCPELPKHSCQCGQAYCESGIVPEERNAIVYLKPFKFSCERPLYALDCPNRRGGCRIPYIGVHDGLWRVSSTMVIDLDLIKTSIEESVFEGGASLESRCERLREQYSEAVEYGVQIRIHECVSVPKCGLQPRQMSKTTISRFWSSPRAHEPAGLSRLQRLSKGPHHGWHLHDNTVKCMLCGSFYAFHGRKMGT